MSWRPMADQSSPRVQLSCPVGSGSVHECSKMVSVLHFKKSLPNRANKLLNQMFSWQRLRKVKSIDAINNVCVILKSEQSTRTLNQSGNRSVTESFHSQTSVTPAVSFINRGEGLISMQLMDRIMINDNQLYSMGLSQYELDYKNQVNQTNTLLELSTEDLKTNYFTPMRDYSMKDHNWFFGSIDRQNAIKLLDSRPIGSFIVRHSTTDTNCFALTIKVPNDYQMTGIAHYLIAITNSRFKIKGFTKEFESLESLLVHHSVMKELLPCPLLMPNRELTLRRDHRLIPNLDFRNELIDDTLVDIDSDPNYQKVLIKFRKNMYQIIS